MRELEYPTGEKCTLELLCLPGVVENAADAEEALRALHDSVLWVQISTGPEQYEHEKERKEVYRLIEELSIYMCFALANSSCICRSAGWDRELIIVRGRGGRETGLRCGRP